MASPRVAGSWQMSTRVAWVSALIGSVIELGELTGTATPAISAVHALLRLLVQTMHDEHARVVLQRL